MCPNPGEPFREGAKTCIEKGMFLYLTIEAFDAKVTAVRNELQLALKTYFGKYGQGLIDQIKNEAAMAPKQSTKSAPAKAQSPKKAVPLPKEAVGSASSATIPLKPPPEELVDLVYRLLTNTMMLIRSNCRGTWRSSPALSDLGLRAPPKISDAGLGNFRNWI